MTAAISTAPRLVQAALAVWCGVLMVGGPCATAAETDQYLTWEITLADSAPALNTYLDQEIRSFVDKMNRRSRPAENPADMTVALYQHLFAGLHASRIRNWLKTSDAVARYPEDDLSDWAYQRRSIFRAPAFPFVLPMAQTVRLGDIYLGIDKIGHMFGFGRRYFQLYHRFQVEGDDHDAALERVFVWGIHHESHLVGKLVDGIFSHGDMEANYQGLRLALALSSGEKPLFYQVDGTWHYRGGLDIREYVTPELDESYNTSDYSRWRGKQVWPIVEARYGEATPPERFALYQRNYKPSLSKQFLDAWFNKEKAVPPQAVASR